MVNDRQSSTRERLCWPRSPAAALALAGLLAAAGLTGCSSVRVEEQRLVSKPNMEFSRSTTFNYSSKLMPQILPGLAVSGGAQASTCTICR
jgi:hypothetical protein